MSQAGGFTPLLWALKQTAGVTSTTKLVLICLARYADRRGRCHPSLGRLAEDTRLSERACRAALRTLQTTGLIQAKIGAGPQGTSVYRLHLDVSEAAMGEERGAGGEERPAPLGAERGAPGGRNDVPKGEERRAPELSIELPAAATRTREADRAHPAHRPSNGPSTPGMPRLSDPPSAWHHLADRQSDGSPKIETGILASELQARMDAIGVSIAPTPASDIGRPIVGGFYLDVTVREVCSAAGYKDPDLRLDWRFVVGWLRDGLNPDKDILPAIRKIASRPNYVPPRSLKYFEEAMRERLRHVT